MFALRSFSRSGKRFTNHICTSSVINSKSRNKPSTNGEKKEKPSERNLFSTSKKIKQKSKSAFELLGESLPEGKPTVFGKFMKQAVNNVAQELGGDVEQTKKDLFDHLVKLEITKEKEVQEVPHFPEQEYKSVGFTSILGSESLNLFKKMKDKETEQPRLNIWNDLESEEIAYKAEQPPRNYFEELIKWTNEGKIWVFPIDNDQGADREAKVNFTEHVFLDKYLEPWCPKSGPIRKFMNLVLIGLGKNPYLTVEEKREHISWFETYFENKKKLLQELGALGTKKELEPPKTEDS